MCLLLHCCENPSFLDVISFPVDHNDAQLAGAHGVGPGGEHCVCGED